ncbi:MAG: hypothetical protein A3K19_25950 [Lentisphaerae bacterium RIFOXYB12_FULL_65_16]|nr:MAG: hypothetical protein A3K18_06810 [Lentisphaerae bacterium RIFOXYA12_64_32]OGV92613.1 MAG: hypothetical protein A3K19_25950 [Lentisphaerae bacterium RIFOXYB12_FULL_65_16]
MMTTMAASQSAPPPGWALAQRLLMDRMNEVAPVFQERYTRHDGTFVWRRAWPGMDGSDDGYESYHNWPLFYALGGSADVHRRSRFLWDAVTRQFTAYGQVWREFDAYYDWMHHGESSIYLYYFGLADPTVDADRERALRFAHMYTGDDPEAPNWDAARRLMRSPITGSRGPRLENSWDDWATHRAVLARYPAPFEDIPGVTGPIADWNDDKVYAEILRLLNARQMRGDVPLNLTATSLVTHAFAHTGDDRYRRWVLDYLEAWAERIAANGGLCPDNVGPNGRIGELMDGKWWGGYYGWRWPHGFMSIIQPLTIAAMNAVLLTGDMRYLDIPRGQLDRMVELGRTEAGKRLIPTRHTDQGWTKYEPLRPEFPLQLWYMSQDPHDAARLELFPERQTDWKRVLPGRGKGDDIHIAPWYWYIHGEAPDYPQQILDTQWAETVRRLDLMAHDNSDPETWDVHHWQQINPVCTEALVQLTCGGPQIIYHGGLLHVRLRYFDRDARRPGLPPDVGALVSRLDADSTTVTLVNTSMLHERHMILQSGAFGEHEFTEVQEVADGGVPADGTVPVRVNARHFNVVLPPGRTLTLRLGLRRYVHAPSYAQPV